MKRIAGVGLCVWAAVQSLFAAGSIEQLYKETGVQGGIVVHLPCGSGRLTTQLHANDRYLVQGLDPDIKHVQEARRHVQSEGLYGKVTINHLLGKRLPYTDNLVNLLVLDQIPQLPPQELFRVLAPLGSAVIMGDTRKSLQDGLVAAGFKIRVKEDHLLCRKPWPDSIDEWTHWLHGADNNPVSRDRISGIPRNLQWIQDPLWIRHHNLIAGLSAMVTSKGRVFYIMDEAAPGVFGPDKWSLIARDAFNGMLLWKKPIKEWGWTQWGKIDDLFSATTRFRNPHQTMRRLVADGDNVYVTLGVHAPVTRLHAPTGRELMRYEGSEKAFEIVYYNGLLVLAINHNLDKPELEADVSIAAYDAAKGTRLWERKGYSGIAPYGHYVDASLVVSNDGIYFVDREEIVGLDVKTGKDIWRVARPASEVTAKVYNYPFKYYSPDLCTLVYGEKTLFFSQIYDRKKNTGKNKKAAVLFAVDAKSGKKLWSFDCVTFAHATPPDIFINQNLVWTLEDESQSFVGLEPRTGKKRKEIFVGDIMGWKGGHHNCYRNKSTSDFIITGKEKGSDFVDLNTGKTARHNWVKGACRYGFMPANGMLYYPSHNCRCYISTKLNGFVALAEQAQAELPPSDSSAVETAASIPLGKQSDDPASWPMYRGDTERRGHSPASVGTNLKQKWSLKLSGKLTPPVVAGDKVFVASKDEHRIICVDRSKGTVRWEKTMDGRIDSSPTYNRGRLVFGSRSGYIHCLDADTGRSIWRFRAAPDQMNISSFGQIESAWPAVGSVLVQDGKVYCTAGRSSHLNGGIYVYVLDLLTGKPLQSHCIKPDRESHGEMDNGLLVDLFTGDSRSIHMAGMLFKTDDITSISGGIWKNKQKDRQNVPFIKPYGGFLDSTLYNASYWVLNQRPNVGHLLVVDDKQVYGFQIYKKYNAGGSYTEDVLHLDNQQYSLFSNDIVPIAASRKDSKKKKRNKGKGSSISGWRVDIPIRATAMVSAADHLYVAGVEGKTDKTDPWKYLDGRMGSILAVYAKSNGEEKFELKLDSVPVFDGLAAAYGQLYMSTQDGRLTCFSD